MTVPLNFKHSKKREGEMAIKIEQMQTRRGGGVPNFGHFVIT